MLKEFKEFAVKGNVIDLAVGVIIGAAFGKIVTSFVEDIIMPLIGMLTGKVNFVDKFIVLSSAKGTDFPSLAEAKKAGAAVLAYGNFINVSINFLIIAFVVFLMVKQINKLKREPAPAVPNTKDWPFCTSPIALAATRGDLSAVGPGCDEQFEFEFALDLLLDGFERLRDQGWTSRHDRELDAALPAPEQGT